MWKWFTRRDSIAQHVAAVPVAERNTSKMPGRAAEVASKHASLHKYLANRYADMVVLTFSQLEDLLGFALPDSAHTRHEWWTSTDRDADQSSCADAWILAGRTAKPAARAAVPALADCGPRPR